MNGWFTRWLSALLTVGAGGLIGRWLGGWLDAPFTGLSIGVACGLTLWQLAGEVQVARLLNWLHTASDTPAPRSARLWGEMAYRIEKALRNREHDLAIERQRLTQFLSGIEASPNGILMLDADDQISWCNRVSADHLGLDARRDLRQPVTNLVRGPDFVEHLRGQAWGEPVTMPAPAGGGMLSVLIRRYGDGQKLVLTQDITERLRVDTMRRDFVANVSHEVRTPLTVLAGFVETMASLPLNETERKRVLSLMRQQAERMQVLVADLLTLSQLEGGPRPPLDQWVDVDGLMQRAADDATLLSAGRHELVCQVSSGAALAGREAELQSALNNLLTNAVRYTPTGGRIEMGWTALHDGGGELAVRDNGIGVSREHLPRLTERFYRVDGSRSRETGGTGLGLSIVKHVMQRHGGTLQVESEPGKGSCFRLRFPPARVRPALPVVATSIAIATVPTAPDPLSADTPR